MTVWPDPGTVVVVLTASAVARSKSFRAMASYVSVSFAASMKERCTNRPAPRLRELEQLCYENVKAQIAADAAEAHNRKVQAAVQADTARIGTETSGPATSKIYGRRELQRIEFESEAAKKRLEDALARFERAIAVIEAKGGSVSYEPADMADGDPKEIQQVEVDDSVKVGIRVPDVRVESKDHAQSDSNDTTGSV